MSLKKQFDAKKKLWKVTFTLAENIVDSSNRVNLVGDFNDWNVESIPMKKVKNGDYAVTINLEKDMEYQFRYFVEGLGWLNEEGADKQVSNNYQTENSVVVV